MAASSGRFLNPQGALQVYENLEGPRSKFYDNLWELPVGATADLAKNEPTLSFSPDLASKRTGAPDDLCGPGRRKDALIPELRIRVLVGRASSFLR